MTAQTVMGTCCSNGTAGVHNGVKLEAMGRQMKRGKRAVYSSPGSRPGSEGYIRDKYARWD